jgi:hypothetical protein
MPGVPGDLGSWPEGQCGQYAAKDALARDASVTCVYSNAEGEGLKFWSMCQPLNTLWPTMESSRWLLTRNAEFKV